MSKVDWVLLASILSLLAILGLTIANPQLSNRLLSTTVLKSCEKGGTAKLRVSKTLIFTTVATSCEWRIKDEEH